MQDGQQNKSSIIMLVEMKWMGFSERIKIVNWYLKMHDSAFNFTELFLSGSPLDLYRFG